MNLDGKALAAELRKDLTGRVATFAATYGRAPGLEVILVGNDPASEVYTKNKEKSAKEIGIRGVLHKLPESTSESDLLALVDRLNRDDQVDGILVQLPLPKAIRAERVLDAIAPEKDVDGFHPINVGKLSIGRSDALVACTPRGCMKLLALSGVDPAGKHAVIVGRSNIVGKPMAQLLLAENATVTVAHSRTSGLRELCLSADILVAAVGRPEMIRGDYIKPGAVVIDVGINRVTDGEGKTKLVGDVAFIEAATRASAITPVPGGVGPMTIACLLENTLLAANQRMSLRSPKA